MSAFNVRTKNEKIELLNEEDLFAKYYILIFWL